MKAPICAALLLYLGLASSLTAQNFTGPADSLPEAERPLVEASGVVREVPAIKVQAATSEAPAVYAAQDAITLEPRMGTSEGVDSVVDLSVLQKASPFRNITAGRPVAEVETDGIKQDLALVSATYRVTGRRESDCQNLALSVEQSVKLDSSNVLEIVEREMKSNPACACEIVKAAIKSADADTTLVVAIVEMAIVASPESMRVVSQCAIASAPESLAEVQALLSRYDANAGESGESAKSAKSDKGAKVASAEMPDTVAAMPNPLDFPGIGPVGAAPGGQPHFNPVPPVVITPPVTEVSP
jgi:hypothetical protein